MFAQTPDFSTDSRKNRRKNRFFSAGKLCTLGVFLVFCLAFCLAFGAQVQADEPQTSDHYTFVPTLTDNLGISYPRENSNGPVVFTATDITTRQEGAYTVYVLAGDCHLSQGNDSFRAEKMVLWVGPVQLDETRADSETPQSVQPVLLYLEDDVEIVCFA